MIAQQLVFDFCIFSFQVFTCSNAILQCGFPLLQTFTLQTTPTKTTRKKSERGKKSKHMVLHQWIFSTVLPFDTKKKKKPATFVFVVIICFMFLLKPKIHCSLLRWSVRVRLNKKKNFFTVACAPLMNLRVKNAIMFPLFKTFCLSFWLLFTFCQIRKSQKVCCRNKSFR